jgi:FixJ family two-component response regulator
MIDTPPLIYVVDDEPAVCVSLKRLLRSIELEARTYTSAQEFLRSERPDAPGCLVLDVRLPGLSGLDLQQELAAAKIDLPVILITGHGDISMSVRAMKAGAVEFLTKPRTRTAGSNRARDQTEPDRETTRGCDADIAQALCTVDAAGARSAAASDQWFTQQADCRTTWRKRKDDQGASWPGYAEDEGRISG